VNYKLHFLKPFLAFMGVLALCTSLYGCGGGTEATATTNVAPTANPGPSQNVVVGAVVSMDGSASKDSDGGSLTFKWTLIGKPNGSAATLTNPTYPNPRFTADFAGNYVVSLVVNDGKADSTVATVSVTATVANAAPVANAGVNQNVVIGSTVTLDGTASTDANNDSLSYKWVLQSKPATSSATLTPATSAKPTFKADVAGTYVATLVVSDGKASSELVAISILASATNLAPVAKPGANQSVAVGSKVSVDASASSDPNGDSITYRWSLLFKPVGSTATLSSTSTVSATLTADLAGTYLLGLTVNDGKVDSPVVVLTVTAAKLNAVPVASAGTNQNVTVSTLATLDGTASTDADLDGLSYTWTLISKPSSSSAALSSSTSPKPTFTPDVAGTYVASLVVSDGKDRSPTAVVTVIASVANSAPVAYAGVAQSVSTASVVTLNGLGSTDANRDPLTYRWTLTSKPTNSTAALSSATVVSPSFTADLAGSYVANLVVNDGQVDSTNISTITVTVSAANSAPVANAGPVQTVSRTGGTVTVTLTGAGSTDANSDTLTYKWTVGYQPTSSSITLSSTTTVSPTFAATVAGVYVFTLVVNDGKVDSAVSTVAITVN
jgi:preprotein translocase subunit SecF